MSKKQIMKKKHLEEEQVKLRHVPDAKDHDEYEYITVPPDGGFGWVVAFAAMVLCSRIKSVSLV